MKGQAVADLLAFTALARSGIVPERDVLFVMESGEESYDQMLGFGWLLAHRPDLVAGVTDVFNEGGVNEVKTTEIERFGVEVMQKAILSVDVLASAKAPLEDLAAAVKARDEAEPVRVVPAVRDFLRFIAPSRSDVWGRRMLEDPAKLGPGTEFWKVVPEVYRSLLKDMAYTGRVVEEPGGGFSMRLVRTLLPGSSVAAAEAELDGWLSARRLGEARRPEDGRLRRVPDGGRGLARRHGGVRPGPVPRSGRALRPVGAVHVELVPEGPGPSRLRRLALRGELLRRDDDSPRERADHRRVLPRRARPDAADPVRVRDPGPESRLLHSAAGGAVGRVDFYYYRVG